MLLDPRRPLPQFLAALDRWITREPAPVPTHCRYCRTDCTDCEHALTATGAERLGLSEDDLVCYDCERLSREVSA